MSQASDGKYFVKAEAAQELIEGYTKIGSTLVPQLFFVTLLFSILIAYFSFGALTSIGYIPFLVAAAIAAIAMLWYETFKLWRKLVSEKLGTF